MIPISKPEILKEDIERVNEVLNSSILSGGPFLEAFENSFAEFTESRYAVAVSSGTAALHIGLKSMGLQEGDEVITSPFSFIASANSILFEGYEPVFVDISEMDFGLDPGRIEGALTERTKAILPIHVFGIPCQIDVIQGLARQHNLKLIEDSCEALGAKHHGHLIGSFGDVSAYGFYPNKQLTTGEGGIITTNDEETYLLIKSLRNQGRDTTTSEIKQVRLGYNYRMSELNAALGFGQLKRLHDTISRRSQAASWYNEALSDIDEIRLPGYNSDSAPSWFVYSISVQGEHRDQLIHFLNQKGIQSKAYFSPCIHLQPYYRKRYGFIEGMFPVAERISSEMVAIPFFTQITKAEVQQVTEAIKDYFASTR
jgi:perosamine synthetase